MSSFFKFFSEIVSPKPSLVPLFEACRWGKIPTIEQVTDLIKQGADINERDNAGGTVLHAVVAVSPFDEEELVQLVGLVELLIAQGADIKAIDNTGKTVLHAAAPFCRKQLVELLIAKGADIKAIGNEGSTVLHKLVLLGEYEVVELLLAKGADINAKDNEGQTPLKKALSFLEQVYKEMEEAHTKFLECDSFNDKNGASAASADFFVSLKIYAKRCERVKFFIEKGDNFTLENNEDKMVLQHVLKALELVEIKAQETHIELLTAAGRKSDSELNYAQLNTVRDKLLEILKALMRKEADLNAADDEGQTPLHKVLQFLDSHSLEVDKRGLGRLKGRLELELENARSVALQRIAEMPAVDIESLEISKEVLERNLQFLCESEQKAYEEKSQALNARFEQLETLITDRVQKLVEFSILFIDSGADVTLSDSRGVTPMDYIDKMEASAKRDLNQAISERPFREMWSMDTHEYTSYFQWLPREVAEDVMKISTDQEKGSSSSRPGHTR